FDVVEVVLRVGNLLETRQLYSAMRRSALVNAREVTQAELLARQDRVRGVLRDGCITPVYQPIVDVETRAIVGHEALSRFPQPHERGPAGWFHDAASVGLGIEIEWLAATKSLDFLQNQTAAGFLAINMSPPTI